MPVCAKSWEESKEIAVKSLIYVSAGHVMFLKISQSSMLYARISIISWTTQFFF